MINTRLLLVWVKLLTGEMYWAKVERESIELALQNKRQIIPKDALNSLLAKVKHGLTNRSLT